MEKHEENRIIAEPAYLSSKGTKARERYDEFAIFRRNLQMLQASKNLNNREMGEVLGLRPKRIEDFREGRLPPKFDELRAIVKYFDVTLDQMLYQKAVISFEVK